MTERNNAMTAFVFTFLMLISPLASSASISTFSGGDSESIVEIRDASDYTNSEDGTISLPAGDTVTSASVDISTSMALHENLFTVDGETQQYVWDPFYNNQLTEYSNINDFTYDQTSVKLVSGGFSSDFERIDAGFRDITNPPVSNGVGWQHGTLTEGAILNDNCNTGNDCWGTNMFDVDNDYTNDDTGSGFTYEMISPAMQVLPGAYTAKFSSWHGFHWSQINPGTNPTNYYYDCGYVMVRNSSNPTFPPPEQGGWVYVPFDMTNSSGISFSNGLYPVGSGNGKIQSCGGLSGNDYALGGESTDNTTNPTGWGSLALNLARHAGKYVELKFVMKHNSGSGTPENTTMPGWFIDDFRIGDPLPQNGWMTLKSLTPKQAPNPGFPDGYGLVTLEQQTTPTNSLTVTVLRGSTTDIVVDRNGNQMTGLEGPIIELWDIDTSVYPVIDLRFIFDTGQYRLSTSVLHGINVGTRVGTGLNDTNVVFDPMIVDGVWMSPGANQPLMYSPNVLDDSFTPAIRRTRFSQPIMGITPVVLDDCAEVPTVQIGLRDHTQINLTIGTQWQPETPIFGFSSVISYGSPCGMSELWFDLEFGHSATGVILDVANDGDAEWGMVEPAFGAFGRQSVFWAGSSNGINYGMDSATITLNSIGEGTGASFMLPKGANISNTDITLSGNTIGEFSLSLISSGQEKTIGQMPNQSLISFETMPMMFSLTDSLNEYMNDPLLQTSVIDEYGNEWSTFQLKIVNTNALSNSQVTVSHLDIFYDWTMTLGVGQNLDRELNQGIALGTGATVDVPISLSGESGGAVEMSSLIVTTSTGYDSTLTLPGNPVGLYPNGDIIEADSTHSVDPSTGTTFAEARLRMESSSGVVELGYSDLMGFSEIYDPNNFVSLESSAISDVGDSKHITWRFRINTAWEDTAEVRLYASLIAADGVNGLPGAVVLAPADGNAIENDAYIASFELQNDAGQVQDLTSAKSNQNIKLIGSIRLEGLDVAPDPTAYNMSLQRWDHNSTNGTVTSEWVEIANSTGIIGGDFNWNVDLGSTAAGDNNYRFLIDGYTGGDTLCPPVEIVSDSDCAIPFNLSIDTYSPTLVNISVLKSANYDQSIWSNWRGLVDDTWVLPSNQQKVRVVAQDIPNPPSSLDMYYWVEYDHDTDADGEADADEYVMITLMSDGNAPTANYTGTYSDDANMGQEPAGKVSIYIIGFDLGGNPIEAGNVGFEDDLVTYVSMSAKAPNIRNFFIENAFGERLHNPNEGAPRYQGPFNMSMYAGNEYHLIVEAVDENGWRDISYFEIDLGPENMVIYYSPRNETAWANTDDITIIEASNLSDGPQVLRMDGGRLVDPFEDEFYLDLPIRMNWNIVGIESTTYVPQLRIKDMDKDPSVMSESGGRHKQRWVYSDGIQLDFRSGITPSFTDLSEPYTTNIQTAFVFPGDTIAFEGQFAYVDGINNGVYVLPQGELTLEVTRLEAMPDFDKGYFAYQGEVTTHLIDGGAFNINITAPVNNNEYTYTFQLINLPTGAVDSTDALCEGGSSFGCASFKIKVDGIKPKIDKDSWTATASNGEILSDLMPSSTLHCVDVQAIIQENAALLAGEVNLRWRFFKNADSNLTWVEYGLRFGVDSQSADLNVKRQGGDYMVSADCVDLWPDPQEPKAADMVGIDVILWIEGRDSAGWSIEGGGPNDAGGVSSIWSSDASHNSQYRLVHQEATFVVTDVRMNPKSPQVDDTPIIEISIKNTGTMDGNLTLEVQSVTDGSFPVTELTYTTDIIQQSKTDNIFITLEKFTTPTTGMYFLIVDADSNEVLWNGSESSKDFNVAVKGEDGGLLAGSGMLIVIGLAALILILLVAVVVLVKRDSGDGTYEYESNEGDVKEYVDIPAAIGPPPGAATAAPVDPLMAQALQEFPQWDQATIQGYFDQGWDIPSLHDWVNSNK
ncbi:MAG TPA: hypothetical protein EYQ73_08105 [Candidatus Poseidoniales archaeon]|nr:hypothetical protein [Candidatus Poseidoniales archaeon]